MKKKNEVTSQIRTLLPAPRCQSTLPTASPSPHLIDPIHPFRTFSGCFPLCGPAGAFLWPFDLNLLSLLIPYIWFLHPASSSLFFSPLLLINSSSFHPSTYLGIMSNTTIPLSSPSFVETYWASLFEGRDEALVTLALLFISHEIIYFGRCVPYLIADQMPSLQKYKIQQKTIQNTSQNQWKVFRYVLMSHFIFELPMIVGFHPIAVYFGMAISAVPFPSITKMIFQIALFFIFEDFFHYWAHRGLHYGPFYKHIHKLHHEWSAPFGLAAEYAHPIEVIILGTGTIGGPLIWCFFTHDLHLITTLTWMTLRLFQAVEAHSGYDFPWSTHNWLPFWSGSEHHDYHHMAFTNNFSTSFRWWDHIFGTNKKYLAYKERKASELKAQAAKKAL